MPTLAQDAASIAPPDGHNPDFDATAAEEESYWYSRYSLMSLVMQSGNGVMADVPMDMVMGAVGMVDANPDDGNTVMVPQNVALLGMVYAGGDPHFTTAMNPDDFGTMRWVGGDESFTLEASAWTIVKETEWARLFHVDKHFGTPTDNFGAQERFAGMVMALSAKMHVMAWLQSPDAFDTDLSGQYVMLEALSDTGSMLAAETQLFSETNRYADLDAVGMFLGAANDLFTSLAGAQPHTVKEWSLAAQSAVWFAANTQDEGLRSEALDRLAAAGDALLGVQPESASETAYAIRGLIEAARITGNSAYQDQAIALWNNLVADYDAAVGTFASQSTYTTDDVAAIVGALNALRLFGGDQVNNDVREAIFAGFYEGTINLSGLQIATPPVELFKGAYEQTNPEIYYRYPSQPMPPMAGGEFGIAPVFAASVTLDNGTWTADTNHFDTAGAMHASNEMIWYHADEIYGFPTLP
ncbi:MAG: hypothetical protein K8I60_04425 [Anaerolineae bacterium]|nr:hypothetical protein [Anaerolineae bacterium]